MTYDERKRKEDETTRRDADRADDLKDLSSKKLDESQERNVKGGVQKVREA